LIDSVDDVEPLNLKSTDFSRRRTVICEAQSNRVFFFAALDACDLFFRSL